MSKESKLINLYNSHRVDDIDFLSTLTNRGTAQTKFLLSLVKNDFKLLVLLETAICSLYYSGCPSTQEEVTKIINLYNKKDSTLYEKWLDNIEDATILNGFNFDINSYEKIVDFHIVNREYSANCIEMEVQFIVVDKWRHRFSKKRKLVMGGLSGKKESDVLIKQSYDYLKRIHGLNPKVGI